MVSPNNSYAPPKSTVADIGPGIGEFELASRGTRLGAAVADTVIILVGWIPAMIAAGRSIGLAALGTRGSPAYNAAVVSAFGAAGRWVILGALIQVALLIVTVVLVHRNGQTIGKKWLGIKVVRSDGSRASLGRIFWLRNVVNGLPSILPVVGKIYVLIDSLFICGEAQRCIHDHIADTIVVQA